MKSKILLVIILLVTSSCALFSGDKGDDSDEDKAKRLSIILDKKPLQSDELLEYSNISISPAVNKYSWNRSQGVVGKYNENVVASSLSKTTSVSIGKGVGSKRKYKIAPVIGDGKVFTIDSRGLVTAFKQDNIKKKLWKYEIEKDEEYMDFVNGGISYDDGSLYITTGYNKVISLDAQDGEIIWQKKLNATARSAPALSDSLVIVATAQNTLYALSKKSGSIKWKHSGSVEDLSLYGTPAPLVHKNVALVSYSSGEFYALNANNGAVLWFDLILGPRQSSSFISDIDSTPFAVGDRVFVSSSQGILASYNIFSGIRLWAKNVGKASQLWYAGGYLFLVNDENKAMALNAGDGLVKWVVQLPKYKDEKNEENRYYWSAPVIANDEIKFVGNHGKFKSISVEDGSFLQERKIAKNVDHRPVISNGSLFLINSNAKLYKYSGT